MTTAAQANTVNTLLAIARLNQTGQELRSRQALREDVQAIKQQQLEQADLAQRQAQYQAGAESMFGDKYTQEMGQYTEPVRPMFARGAMTEGALPTSEVSPSGYPLPGGLVRRQPTAEDIQGRFSKAGARAREETLAEARTQGVDVNQPELYNRLQTQQTVPLPSQVGPRIKAYEEGRQALQTTRYKTAQAGIEEANRVVGEATTGTRVAEQAAKAKREAGLATQAEAEGKMAEARAPYASILAAAEADTRVAEAAVKNAEMEGIPVKKAQALATLEYTRRQNVRLAQEADQYNKVQEQVAYIRTLKPDDPKYTQALQDLATISNQPGTVLSNMHAVNQAWATGVERGVVLKKQIRDFMKEGTPEGDALAQTTTNAANQISINNAKMMNQPKAEIMAVVPGGKGWTGTSGSTLSRSMVNTDVAELYENKTLDKIAQLDPVAMQAHPEWTPGLALSQIIAIKHAYSGDDSTVYADALAKSNYPAIAKEQALPYLQKASATVRPITQEEPSAPAKVEAPGLSVSGTVKGAGSMVGTGLEKTGKKLAPYQPMNVFTGR